MSKTIDKAKDIIKQLTIDNKTILEVKGLYSNEEDWIRVSSKAYSLYLEEEKEKRLLDGKKLHVSLTPTSIINLMIDLNAKLSEYAVGIPTTSTEYDLKAIIELAEGLPVTEKMLFERLEFFNMSPKFRSLQKNGRFKHFEVFKEFDHIIDAALLCYYRTNYISCFLTLVPVVEGVLLRWIGHDATIDDIDFEQYKSFFKRGARRNPCPGNPQFHEVFSRLCDDLLNKHLYKSSKKGDAYNDFNRHSAVHLFKTPEFGTKHNCIRLFILIDFMTEIYLYEGRLQDPRFSLKPAEFDTDLVIYANVIIDQQMSVSAEKKLLNDPQH